MSKNDIFGIIDVWIDNFTPCLQDNNTGEIVEETCRPISLSEMPYTLDIRAVIAYAKSKGIAVSSLTEKDRQNFLVPNKAYHKKTVITQ